jgi:hypothetical protein
MKNNENNLQLNKNNNHKKIEKGEKSSKSTKFKEKNNYQSYMDRIFLYLFLMFTVLLTISLYMYYKFNSDVGEELSFMKDIHKLKANLKEVHFVPENTFIKNKEKINSNNY